MKKKIKSKKNPVTRTWDNLRRWIYLYLGEFSYNHGNTKLINREKAREICEEYFDLSPDPVNKLIYMDYYGNKSKPEAQTHLRFQLFDENLRKRLGKSVNNYITKYKGKHAIFHFAINYFAEKWEEIFNNPRYTIFKKEELWRKEALENYIIPDDLRAFTST